MKNKRYKGSFGKPRSRMRYSKILRSVIGRSFYFSLMASLVFSPILPQTVHAQDATVPAEETSGTTEAAGPNTTEGGDISSVLNLEDSGGAIDLNIDASADNSELSGSDSSLKKKKEEEPPPGPSQQSMSSTSGSGSTTGGSDGSPNTIKQVLPEVDQITGALIFDYALETPPGRNGIEPDLGLVYNSLSSNNADNVFGYGWEDNIPYIRRVNKEGVEKLYSENYFESSFSGELVPTSSSTIYEAKVENGDFLKYEFVSNAWTVTDKLGRKYKFGTTASSRQDDPNNSGRIFSWELDEMRDLNDNYATYEYFKDDGQIYPSKISYTKYSTDNVPFEISFIRENRSAIPNFSTGFEVNTNYRISDISVKFDGNTVRNYDFSYASSTNHSLVVLDSAVETGYGSGTTTLPATNFDYQESVIGFDVDSGPSCPGTINTTDGIIFADVDGDGLSDILQATGTATSTHLKSGSGWVASSTFDSPLMFSGGSAPDLGVRVMDIDADGRADIFQSRNGTSTIYFSTSSGWELNEDPNWAIPEDFVDSSGNDNNVRIVDINSDGLPDIVRRYFDSGTWPWHFTFVHLNNGNSWTEDSGWTIPGDNLSEGFIFADLNNDGLMDMMQSYRTSDVNWSKGAWINDGEKGFENVVNLGLDDFVPFLEFIDVNNDQGVREADVNGDGYSDLIRAMNNRGQEVFLNTGTGFATSTAYAPSWYFVDSGSNDTGVRLVDYNGDGMVDALDCNVGGGSSDNFWGNTGVRGGLLSHIKSPFGGLTNISYKPTTEYKSGSTPLNPELPYILDTVSSIAHGSDGISATSTKTFSYKGGKQYYADAHDRKIAGFSEVTSTDPAGNVTTSYFHQGDTSNSDLGEYNDHFSKIGKVYRTEVEDSSGNIYSKTINKWDKFTNASSSFVSLISSLSMSYDGDADHKDKAEDFSYSTTTGNITEKIEYGEVSGSNDGTFTDTGSDKRITDYTYASNESSHILGLPKTVATTNASSTKIREQRYYYDNNVLGVVDEGNLTKQESWKSGSTYIDIEKTYNGYGLVTQEKDPRNKATNFVYDTWNLYPATSTNPLSQSTTFEYDYPSGQVTQRTDPNGLVFQSTYDGLGRLTEQKQPDLATPSTLVTKTAMSYTDAYNSSSILRTDYLGGATSTLLYTYLDGFGRTIQTRVEAEDASTFVAVDTVYNNLERVEKESLPYFSSGSSRTTATTTSALFISYNYDPLMRVGTTTNAVGTITTGYDQWITTVTDALGIPKSFYNDAYGNLIQVDETNATSTYTTLYEYDLNDNLTKITDDLDNVRNFTYDGLNRRLTAQDLHAPADGTFGTWTYTYDDSSNLTKTVDPKSQTVDYTYDDVNRVLTENYTGQAGTEVSYNYDDCTYGIGRLCTATSTDAVANLTYNALGFVDTETKTLNSINYVTEFDYDRQGNLTAITYPDDSIVSYSYDSAGLLDAVSRKPGGSSEYFTAISELTYAPTGDIAYKRFGNGVESIYTYNASQLYRLTNILTIASSTWEGGGPLAFLNTPSYAYPQGITLASFAPPFVLAQVTQESDNSTLEQELVTEPQPTEETSPLEDVAQVLEEKIADVEAVFEELNSSAEEVIVDSESAASEEVSPIVEPTPTEQNIVTSEEVNVDTVQEVVPAEEEPLPLEEAPPIAESAPIEEPTALEEPVTSPDQTPVEESVILEQPVADPVPTLTEEEVSPAASEEVVVDQGSPAGRTPQIIEEVIDVEPVSEPQPTLQPTLPPGSSYSEKADRYELSVRQEAPGSGKATVEVLKDRPEVRFTKWDGEVNFGVSYGGVQASATPDTADRIEWKGVDEEVHAYPLSPKEGMENGGFEIEVVLNEKPTSNVFEFQVDGYENLDFFYQPPLTQEKARPGETCTETACTNSEGKVTNRRPENVVGSYAVYHKEKLNYKKDGKNYTTGKVFHIYRPKAIDADGNEMWGTLSYSGNVLSVTIPQNFLARAAYPVTVDPTFGYTTVGGSSALNSADDAVLAKGAPVDGDGNVSKLTIHAKKFTSDVNAKGVIWKHSDNTVITDGIAGTVSVNSTTAQWWDMTYSTQPSATNNTDYYTGAVAGGYIRVSYDSGSPGDGGYDSNNSYSSPTTLDTIVSNSRKYSVYATYTASTTNSAPSAPTSLETEGETNPTDIADSTPEFSAIYNDSDTSDNAIYYQLQVDNDSDFGSTYWDSTKTTMATTTEGNRSPDITYSGSALASSTTYYWRIKFWDDDDAEGAWSTATSTFSLAAEGGGGPATTTIMQDISYTYDAVGNIIGITDYSDTGAGKVVNFVYDDLYRLTSASTTAATSTPFNYTYSYNSIGNITNKSDQGAYTYNDDGYNNPHAADSISGIDLAYDNNGNLTSFGDWTYTWDYRNRLASSGNGTTTTTYAYDHDGQRVEKSSGGVTSYYPNKYWSVEDGDTTASIFLPNGELIATVETATSGGSGSSGEIFSDTFAESSNTVLPSHTPDTGTGWTSIHTSGSGSSSSVHVHASSDELRGAAADSSAGAMYSADATYDTADYQVKFTMPTAPTGDEYLNIGLRMDGTADNGYLLEGWWGDNHDPAIYEVSSGSFTQLATHDSTIGILFADNDTVRGEVSGSDIIMFDANDIGHLYVSDTTHTTANKATLGFGAYRVAGGDISATIPAIDNFEVITIPDATGWNSPSTTGETDNDWTNPSNAYSSDNSRATIDADTHVGTGAQDYGDFGFSIDSGDTISGIEVRVESLTDSSGYHDLAIALSKDNGSSWSSEKTIRYEDFDADDGTKVAGHANSLWGLSWTPSDLSDANFRAKVRFAAREASTVDDFAIDHISVKVFHEATGGGSTATTTSYIHPDHLGGTNAVTDENGELAQAIDYYPFGAKRIESGTDVSQREYIGEHFDEETDLSYLNARYYENARGQFLSQDPVYLGLGSSKQSLEFLNDPQQLNSYSYAGNNPVRFSDPTGECFTPTAFTFCVLGARNLGQTLNSIGSAYIKSQYPGVFSEEERNRANLRAGIDVGMMFAGGSAKLVGLETAGRVSEVLTLGLELIDQSFGDEIYGEEGDLIKRELGEEDVVRGLGGSGGSSILQNYNSSNLQSSRIGTQATSQSANGGFNGASMQQRINDLYSQFRGILKAFDAIQNSSEN